MTSSIDDVKNFLATHFHKRGNVRQVAMNAYNNVPSGKNRKWIFRALWRTNQQFDWLNSIDPNHRNLNENSFHFLSNFVGVTKW